MISKHDNYINYIVEDILNDVRNVREKPEIYGNDLELVYELRGYGGLIPMYHWPFQTVQHLLWANQLENHLIGKYGLKPHEVKRVYDPFIKIMKERYLS